MASATAEIPGIVIFRLEPRENPDVLGAFAMKRPTRSAEPATLARKRALVRSLIEQHGWASPPPRPLGTGAGKPALAQIIPFPMLGK